MGPCFVQPPPPGVDRQNFPTHIDNQTTQHNAWNKIPICFSPPPWHSIYTIFIQFIQFFFWIFTFFIKKKTNFQMFEIFEVKLHTKKTRISQFVAGIQNVNKCQWMWKKHAEKNFEMLEGSRLQDIDFFALREPVGIKRMHGNSRSVFFAISTNNDRPLEVDQITQTQ